MIRKTKVRPMAEESWVITVRENMTTKMKEASPPVWDTGLGLEQYRRGSIYEVPKNFRDLSPASFRPHVVSFGPYYHGEDNLRTVEMQKQRAVARFLNRSKKPLDSLLNSVAKVMQELRDSYYPLNQSWKNDNSKFLEVMITDGCFMAEILHTAKHGFDGYAQDDPIFSKHGKLHIMPFITRDMLMLENQLPMLLLHKLFAFLGNKLEEEESATIYELITSFFPKLNILEEKLPKCQRTHDAYKNSLHILDVFRKSLLFEPEGCKAPQEKKPLRRSSCSSDNEDSSRIVRSAMELEEAGIKFWKSKSRSLKDLSFQDGILRLPLIIVDDSTESTIRNLLAFEILHVLAGNEVTSYVSFMDNLIDTEKDVAILIANGIIQNALGSNEAVAKLFNSVTKDITHNPEGSFQELEKNVVDYCKIRYRRWRANLVHNYFKSPWSCISLLAAIVLFALTAIQTFYTTYQYHHPPPQ